MFFTPELQKPPYRKAMRRFLVALKNACQLNNHVSIHAQQNAERQFNETLAPVVRRQNPPVGRYQFTASS